MNVIDSYIILDYRQIPIHALKDIVDNQRLVRAIIYYACEYLYSEDCFSEAVFEFIQTEDGVFTLSDLSETMPFVYYNSELFMIQLLIFHDSFKNYIYHIVGTLPRRLAMVDDLNNILKLELIYEPPDAVS